MNRKVPLWFVLLLLWFSFVLTLLFGWAVLHPEKTGKIFNKQISGTIITVASLPSLVKESITSVFGQSLLVRTNVYPEIYGLSVKKKYIDSNYILLSIYDHKLNQSVVKLIRIYDQKVIHEWIPDYDKLMNLPDGKSAFWRKSNIHNLRIYHPLLLPDGSIIFSNVVSPLLKIDKNSNIVWMLNRRFSHSNELDSEGNIWTQSIIEHPKFSNQILDGFTDDAIAKISQDGKLLFEKSIAKILIENGYRGLLLGGINEIDPVHLNDVQPALVSTRYWIKDDLLLSLRHKSTVLLYRPSTNKVVWLKTGPWLNEHDVDFIDSTHIGIFGNNIIRYNPNSLLEDSWSETLLNGYNQEYIYDFKTDKIDTPYTQFLKKAKVSTLSEGRSDILPNGDLFVEETNNNRLLRGNKKDIIWQYVDRIDDHSDAALGWSRFITKEEFKKLTFLKNN